MNKPTGIDVAISKYRINKYVNKENGTVTLKTTVEGCIMSHFFRDICNQLGFNKRLSGRLLGYIHITTPHKGLVVTVKCRPEDKFDEAVGASKAFRKLKGEIRKYVIRSLLAMYDDCENAIFKLYDLYISNKLAEDKDIFCKDLGRIFQVTGNEYDYSDLEDDCYGV